MKSEYQYMPLNDNVEEMFIGPFGSSLKNEAFVDENEAFCMVYEQKHAIKKTMDVETRYVNREKYEELKRFNIKGGDIIVSCRGTIGETFIVPDDAPLGIMHPSIMKIRLRQGVYNKQYFDLLLCSYLKRHEDEANGSGIKMAISAKELGAEKFPVPKMEDQCQIASLFERVNELISLRKQQLTKLDELVKSRFIELFGDPITNSNNLPTERMERRFNLKAGITTAADDIHDFEKGVYEIPCYGGNGIRGYVKDKSYAGNYPIIGRQGALCGNVQYATGDFHATEHAVLVSLLKDDNTVWVYHLLKLMDLYRYHTGAAQPGLAVKTLNTVDVIVADKKLQDQFADFVAQTDKSKVAIQQSLEKLETLKKALMQEYFG